MFSLGALRGQEVKVLMEMEHVKTYRAINSKTYGYKLASRYTAPRIEDPSTNLIFEKGRKSQVAYTSVLRSCHCILYPELVLHNSLGPGEVGINAPEASSHVKQEKIS